MRRNASHVGTKHAARHSIIRRDSGLRSNVVPAAGNGKGRAIALAMANTCSTSDRATPTASPTSCYADRSPLVLCSIIFAAIQPASIQITWNRSRKPRIPRAEWHPERLPTAGQHARTAISIRPTTPTGGMAGANVAPAGRSTQTSGTLATSGVGRRARSPRPGSRSTLSYSRRRASPSAGARVQAR